MSPEQPHVTPEQARARLRAAGGRRLASPHDHRVHAIATATCGVTTGLYVASQNAVWRPAATAAFFAIWLLQALWVERAARAVPRRARRRAWGGLLGSLLLALAVVLPWLNWRAQDEPNTWAMVLAGGLVVALPSLLAAALIARSRP